MDTTYKSDPNIYRLRNSRDEKVEGRFYNEELQKIRLDEKTTYRIEKVLKKRKRLGKNELLVKFIGYPDPEWIKESDIV